MMWLLQRIQDTSDAQIKTLRLLEECLLACNSSLWAFILGVQKVSYRNCEECVLELNENSLRC